MKTAKLRTFQGIFNKIFTIYLVLMYPFCIIRFHYVTNLSKYSWFFDNDTQVDYYLGARSVTLMIAAVLAVIALALICFSEHRKPVIFTSRTITVAISVYVLCVITSTFFSIDRYTSIHGGLDQFESCFTLLSYVVIFIYAYEQQLLEYVLHSRIGSICLYASTALLIVLGFLQGSDVYLTFYNPDYCSIYLFIMIGIFAYKSSTDRKFSLTVDCFFMILLMYLQIRTNCVYNIALTILSLISLAIYCGCYYCKNHRINIFSHVNSMFVRIAVCLAAAVIIIATVFFSYRYILSISQPQLIASNGERIISIATGTDEVTIVTDRDTYHLTSDMKEGPLEYQQANGQMGGDTVNGFSINNGYETMFFTNSTPDGGYVFVVSNGHSIVLEPAEAVIFSNCPSLLSGRGYIWGRTIPLLRHTLLIGTGPDTFLIDFPHGDYVEALVNNYIYQLVNKPHSIYLQIAVQTGVVSLICVLIMVFSQIVSGIHAFLGKAHMSISDTQNGNIAESTHTKKALGFTILVCSIGLCLSGLLNDSNLSVMPYVILIFSAASSQQNRL